ncbi:hypothetical protein JW890_07565 [candidate division WOR-3 bacterium]|nr:hypothetical protein [candidate division WOR-3 bacterium]
MKKNIFFLSAFLAVFSCTFRFAEEDLRLPGNLSGSYMAFGEDYEIETFLAESGEEVFRINQGEGIFGIGLKHGDRLFLSVKGDSSFASGIYIIREKSIDGIWTSGDSAIYTERLSKSGFPGNPILIPDKMEDVANSLYRLTFLAKGDTIESILLVEPTGDITFDALIEAPEGIMTGVGIAGDKFFCVSFFDVSMDSWGVLYFENFEDGSLEGEMSFYGDWKPIEVLGERIED